MKRFFDLDSPLSRFMNSVADLIALNVIWLVCCLPIVTIGPACVAMCYVARQIAQGEMMPVFRTFFRAFRNNFKQGLAVFLILLVPLGLAGLYLVLAALGTLNYSPVLKYLSYFAAVFIFAVCSYVYPLLAHFDNTLKNTLKNAFLLPLFNPIMAVIVTALNLLPILLFLLNGKMILLYGFFWLIGGCSLTALINEKLLSKMFSQYIPSEETSENAEP